MAVSGASEKTSEESQKEEVRQDWSEEVGDGIVIINTGMDRVR